MDLECLIPQLFVHASVLFLIRGHFAEIFLHVISDLTLDFLYLDTGFPFLLVGFAGRALAGDTSIVVILFSAVLLEATEMILLFALQLKKVSSKGNIAI